MKKIILVSFLILFSSSLFAKDNTKIFKLADDIMKKIAEHTNRKPDLNVKKEMTTKDAVIKYVEEQLDKQYKGNEFLVEENVLKFLKIYKWEDNYKQLMLDLLKEQVGGYYDPEKHTMYISEWTPENMQEMILSHELFHAVQDKNFGIMKYLKMDNKNTDAKLAASSLLEGEATAVMMDYALAIKNNMPEATFDKIPNLESLMEAQMKMQNTTMPTLAKSPEFIQRMLIFPYIKGLSFVTQIKLESDWEGLNKAYKKVPVSTEQILHIDKYKKFEKPIDVKLKDPKNVVKDAKFLGETILGEATFHLLFVSDKSDKTNATDADGWGGDKIYVYEKDKSYFAILVTEWDTKKDAEEFFEASYVYFNSFSKKGDINKKASTSFDTTSDSRLNSAIINNKKVILFLNIKTEDKEAAAKVVK